MSFEAQNATPFRVPKHMRSMWLAEHEVHLMDSAPSPDHTVVPNALDSAENVEHLMDVTPSSDHPVVPNAVHPLCSDATGAQISSIVPTPTEVANSRLQSSNPGSVAAEEVHRYNIEQLRRFVTNWGHAYAQRREQGQMDWKTKPPKLAADPWPGVRPSHMTKVRLLPCLIGCGMVYN